MIHHPNFPPSLSITPNDGCSALGHFLEGNNRDAFGVEAQREAISRYGIAGRVWEAAYALCAYVDPTDDGLHDFDPPFVRDTHEIPGVIELGSGTGVVAAAIARLIGRTISPGGFVIATDLPDVCPLLRHNLGVDTSTEGDHSAQVAISVKPLSWGNLEQATSIASEFGSRRLTHIVCSDLVYLPELSGPLLRTLIHLASPPCAPSSGPPVKIVISYKVRSLPKETSFWSAFGLWFSFQPVLARHRVRPVEGKDAPLNESDTSEHWKQFGAHEGTDRIFVFVAHRRPESIAWLIPESDKELMEGVGARETITRKGDDTFETILFMSMGIDTADE